MGSARIVYRAAGRSSKRNELSAAVRAQMVASSLSDPSARTGTRFTSAVIRLPAALRITPEIDPAGPIVMLNGPVGWSASSSNTVAAWRFAAGPQYTWGSVPDGWAENPRVSGTPVGRLSRW